MWLVTLCRGEYRMPLTFRSFMDVSDWIQNAYVSNEGKDLQVVIGLVNDDREEGNGKSL